MTAKSTVSCRAGGGESVRRAGESSRSKTRVRPRCSSARTRNALQEALTQQLAESADEIVQATLNKAKEGSLQHMKWLCTLMKEQAVLEAKQSNAVPRSLGAMLLKELNQKA